MAIGSITVEWLISLRQRNAFPVGAAVLELGPQDVTTSRAVVERAARAFWDDAQASTMLDACFDGPVWRPNSQPAFYRLFGADSYQSVDLSDPRADIAHDLNEPLPEIGVFDIITDFGTSEHVFNIGEVFASVHRLLKVGGVALFAPPTFGFINHGFYNLHPMLFFELANANGYDVIDIKYIDNMFVRCRAQEEVPHKPFPFESLPVEPRPEDGKNLPRLMTDVALRFKHNLDDPESSRLTENQLFFVFDLLFVALRKTTASPETFSRPFQGGFGEPRVTRGR